jgi:Family of unknown function (DUF5832)
MANSTSLVPVDEEDFLSQDPPIRGQRYCCLSFVSPEEVLKNKETYFLGKFLKAFAMDMNHMFDHLNEMYKDQKDVIESANAIKERYAHVFDVDKLEDEFNFYKAVHSASLESEYLQKNNFQTTIRGLKVRGSYETLQEAQIRAQVLKRKDDRFHVYVAEVGCWCPWSPNPEELENQEYAHNHLNTLVKQYLDNQKQKDEFFLQRKETLQQRAIEDNEKNNKKTESNETLEPIKEEFEDEDPWMKKKLEETQKTEEEITNANVVQKVVEDVINNVVENNTD